MKEPRGRHRSSSRKVKHIIFVNSDENNSKYAFKGKIKQMIKIIL